MFSRGDLTFQVTFTLLGRFFEMQGEKTNILFMIESLSPLTSRTLVSHDFFFLRRIKFQRLCKFNENRLSLCARCSFFSFLFTMRKNAIEAPPSGPREVQGASRGTASSIELPVVREGGRQNMCQ